MNSKLRNILYMFSAVVLLVSSITYFFRLPYVPYAFAVGAAGFAMCHLTFQYMGQNLRAKRLHQMNKIASVLMIAASVLMFKELNLWVICLSIAAFLHLYTGFVMPDEK